MMARVLTHQVIYPQRPSITSFSPYMPLQPAEYKKTVIPDGIPVLSIEASHVHGWEKYAHASIGMTYFGKSAPGPVSTTYKHLDSKSGSAACIQKRDQPPLVCTML